MPDPKAKYPVTKTDAEWKKLLTPAAYQVLRHEGTERPGSSPLNKEHRPGLFRCAGCDSPVYSSKDKFESGTGWPSFTRPIGERAIQTRSDTSLFMVRTEALCATCGGHLGHVFPDGPPPTGMRHCLNGVALRFEPRAV
jgi:peptide-methionine (R)-S-oxide reductase